MTYGHLPQPRRDTLIGNGARICARQPVLLCPCCGQQASADPGDYFLFDRDADIKCADCPDELLVLAERRETFIPYDTDSHYDKAVAALWRDSGR